jgi:hypothetical protein
MRWSDIPRNPPESTLRQFAALCLVIFGALAWQSWSRGQVGVASVFAALAVGLGVPGLVQPRLLRRVFVGWMMLVFPIGFAVSQLVLGLIFYGLFTPLALLFRLIGRDALGLKRAPETATYWRTKPMPADVKRYFHPF